MFLKYHNLHRVSHVSSDGIWQIRVPGAGCLLASSGAQLRPQTNPRNEECSQLSGQAIPWRWWYSWAIGVGKLGYAGIELSMTKSSDSRFFWIWQNKGIENKENKISLFLPFLDLISTKVTSKKGVLQVNDCFTFGSMASLSMFKYECFTKWWPTIRILSLKLMH